MQLTKLYSYLNPKYLKLIFLVGVIFKVVTLDQITKEYAFQMHMNYPTAHFVTSFLNFHFVFNKGISFGAFGDFSYANHIFIIINSVICLALIWWVYKNLSFQNVFAIGLIIGGAISNLIDRFRYEAVIDFIDFHYLNWHYPTFNFADAAIVIGVAFILLEPVFEKIKFSKPQNNLSKSSQ